MPNYVKELSSVLASYNKKKGFWRPWFGWLFGDQAAIKKLRSLPSKDQENLFKVCECFFGNTPKPSQASYQVYEKLIQSSKLAALFLKEFEKKKPSSEQQKNLESKIIQELISNNTITFEKASSLNPVQQANLELAVVHNLIAKEIISLDQVLALRNRLSDLEQTNLGSEAIQKLIVVGKIDFNRALSLKSIQRESLEFKLKESTENDVSEKKEINNKLETTKKFNLPEESDGSKINIVSNDKKNPIDENFKTKLSFLADLENDRPPFLSLDQMHHLIQEKKLRREEDLDIFVFPITDYDQLELKIFFGILEKNIDKAPARFQLAIQDNSNYHSKHCYAVDCYIKNSHLYLLIIDPVFFSDTKLLLKCFPESLANISTCFQYRGKNIQYSNYGCSFFAIDNLFRLSNRNNHWHDLLKLEKSSKDKQIVYFSDSVEEFPKSLAFIFKNIQSLTAFESLKISKGNAINKKGNTLQQIVEKYSHNVEIYYEQSKPRNLAILHKREKYINQLENFAENQEKNLAVSRQGFEIIGGKEWVENNIELLTLCIKDFYSFNSFITNIPNAQQIAIYEILREKLRKKIRNGSDFDNFIRNLTLEQRTSEHGMLKENVRPNIRNCLDFYQYLNNLTPEQRIEEYEVLKIKMRTSIQSCSDFQNFIENLNPEQRTVEYEKLKAQMRSMIQNSSSYAGTNFNDFIKNLSSMHCEIEYDLLSEKIRLSINDSYNFSNYIGNLTLEQRTTEYEALKEKIRSSISYVSELNWFIDNLAPEQQKIELEALKEKLRSSVRNGSDFSNYVKYLTPEQRIEEYHKLKQQVRPGILKSEGFGDFGYFLKYLTSELCKIECDEFINFLVKNNYSSLYNRRYFSDAFGTLPTREQRTVVMMAYNSPAFNKKTKVANNVSNSFFSHKAHQENNEDVNGSLSSARFTR